jgi:hypothetical protein
VVVKCAQNKREEEGGPWIIEKVYIHDMLAYLPGLKGQSRCIALWVNGGAECLLHVRSTVAVFTVFAVIAGPHERMAGPGERPRTTLLTTHASVMGETQLKSTN